MLAFFGIIFVLKKGREMMKFYALLTLMFVLCSPSFLISMELIKQEKGRLNFLLDNNLCIKGYSKQNMNFEVKPADFTGKSALTVIDLDEKDHNALVAGYSKAVEKKETVKVPYTFDQKQFAAKITALKIRDAEYNYFVKITQIDNDNQ